VETVWTSVVWRPDQLRILYRQLLLDAPELVPACLRDPGYGCHDGAYRTLQLLDEFLLGRRNCGGCLLLGTLPRLARQVKPIHAGIAAFSLVLLANTRPYEGLVFSGATFFALLYWRKRQRRSVKELLALRCVIPFALVFGSGLVFTGYYNYRVTGSPLQMPYYLYSRDYAAAPEMIIFPERKPPVYRHAEMEKYYMGPDLADYRKARSNPTRHVSYALEFYTPVLYLFPIAIAILLVPSYRVYSATAIAICVGCSFLIDDSKWPHYIAAGVGLLAIVVIYGFRLMRVTSKRLGPSFVMIFVALMCAQLAYCHLFEPPTFPERNTGDTSLRDSVAQSCLKQGGRHLILVHYSADHDFNHEYVYNSANIDASDIVWAHDMGKEKNQELVDYYHNSRKVWLWQPDTDPDNLIPYQTSAN